MKARRKPAEIRKRHSHTKLKLGDLFIRRQERGKPGLPLMSVTLNNGLVERKSLDRKTDSGLSPESHLLIREGDIAYNMMRMWQGASGLARHEGLISPAYVVVTPKNGLNPKFAAHWFKSPRMIYLFWAYSYGLVKDRLRLYFHDFARIPIPTPPPSKKLQSRIATILDAWENGIGQVEKLIEAKRNERQGLTQALIPDKRRLLSNPATWRRFEFSELATLSRTRHDASRTPTRLPCVELENIAQADGRLLAIANSETPQGIKSVFRRGEVLFGKLRPNLRKFFLCTFKGLCSTEIWVLKPNEKICTSEFLFRLVQTDRFISAACVSYGSKMPRADWEWISRQPFRVPSLIKQKKITRVLDTIDREIDALHRLSNVMQKQKRGLAQRLLEKREGNS